MDTSSGRKRNSAPLVLLVQNSALPRASLGKSLLENGFRIAVARGIEEAREMIDDIRFIESQIDGLVVDYRLPDGLGSGLAQDFQRENPGVPALLVLDEDNIALELWSRAKGIRLVQHSQVVSELRQWLKQLKLAA